MQLANSLYVERNVLAIDNASIKYHIEQHIDEDAHIADLTTRQIRKIEKMEHRIVLKVSEIALLDDVVGKFK